MKNSIKKCFEIKPGMTFTHANWDFSLRVLREGNYSIIEGKKIPIDNRKKNKWWVKRMGAQEPEFMFCFDTNLDGYIFSNQQNKP